MNMRFVLCALLAAHSLAAGVVKGVVLEQASGHPLARTRVRLDPIQRPAGSEFRPLLQRAGSGGEFAFQNVPAGVYLLTAMRDGYFDTGHGQRRPGGQAVPFTVSPDSDLFTQLNMRRMGAITGRVVDENNIGIPGVGVVAYRARLPLRAAGRATSDDRGVYRIHGLAPGRYWVRSDATSLDDGSGVLPTFSPETRELQQARAYEARLDTDTPDGDIRPMFGNLFRISGAVICALPDATPITLTLSSETGRRSVQTRCDQRYTFSGLAPAMYEIRAAKEGNLETGWVEFFADRDNAVPVNIMPPPRTEFEIVRSGSSVPVSLPITVIGRRADLSDADPDRPIELPGPVLAPGHWELAAIPAPNQYIESIANTRVRARRERVLAPDAWDLFIEMGYSSRIRVTLSEQAAQITGRVLDDGKAVSGAPVFLWPLSDLARRSLHGWKQVRCDAEGRFHFDSLPPGDYRILATFDLTEPTEESLEEGRAATLRVGLGQRLESELPLWIAP